MSVVFNITFTPNKPRKNATENQCAQWCNERAFYDLSAQYNYVSYSLDGKKTAKNKDILSYMEKSSGAFDLDGELSQERIEQIKEKLAKSDSNIWHGFISFDENTSRLFEEPRHCQEFLKRTLTSLFDNSQLKAKNIELMASLHVDTTHHHHIHFSFWEKEPLRMKDGSKVYTTKGMFPQKCIDNFMISSGLYFEENKHDLHVARDKAVFALKELMPSKERKSTTQITRQLENLARRLPEQGRLQYNSYNMASLRKEVDATVNYIALRNKKFGDAVKDVWSEIAKREKRANELALENRCLWVKDRRYTPGEMIGDNAKKNFKKFGVHSNEFGCIQKLKDDVNARLGQIIINAAKKTKDSTKNPLPRKDNKSNHSWRIVARQNRFAVKKSVNGFLGVFDSLINQVQQDFSHKLHQAEYEIQREQSNRGRV